MVCVFLFFVGYGKERFGHVLIIYQAGLDFYFWCMYSRLISLWLYSRAINICRLDNFCSADSALRH
jgi:hypothetical protein